MKQHFGEYVGPTLIDEKEPLTAWRTWRIAQRREAKRDVFRLVGTWAQKFEWVPRGVTVAECLNTQKDKGCNLSMKEACDCGLWGAAALTNLLEHGAVGLSPVGVLGRAHLWGFVHVYEFGFRASMGRPADLWLGNSTHAWIADGLRGAYSIPVDLGLPVEVVSDPALLPGSRVRAAAEVYAARQPAVVPQVAAAVRHCSGCGASHRRRDTCPSCRASAVKV